jgi:hypothetical protein
MSKWDGGELLQWRETADPTIYEKLEAIAKVGVHSGSQPRTLPQLRQQLRATISNEQYQYYCEFYEEVKQHAD